MKTRAVVPVNYVEERIFIIRGLKVMLDRDLADLYGVETKYLNRQVKRNRDRFPHEFVFQLTKSERNELVTNWHRFESLKHSSTLPYAFSEHGVAMLATVIKSPRAVKMSIVIVKAFVRLRDILSSHKELAEKLQLLEKRLDRHDEEIQTIVEAIHQLLQPPAKPRNPIGFRINEPQTAYHPRKHLQ
ncbi:MAG TPA: ORF6N domain-containing protein [Bacteroidota bacterium]|nr:ORF6N domain-containing protein [Bacteroidota bacterium]